MGAVGAAWRKGVGLPGEVDEIMPLGPWYPLIISKFVVVGRP